MEFSLPVTLIQSMCRKDANLAEASFLLYTNEQVVGWLAEKGTDEETRSQFEFAQITGRSFIFSSDQHLVEIDVGENVGDRLALAGMIRKKEKKCS